MMIRGKLMRVKAAESENSLNYHFKCKYPQFDATD